MAKIVFLGTPVFSIPALQALIHAGHEISLVLCQPDKRRGRGHAMQFPPVKQAALDEGIEVFQPPSIRKEEVVQRLLQERADFFIVIAYGKILPLSVLEIPKKGCINIHASLLPQWRGAAPIQFSLWKGDKNTGVTSMLMDEGLDTGDILLKMETPLESHENLDQLSHRLSALSAECIIKTLQEFDHLTPIKQESSEVTHSRLITKEDLRIDWNQDAEAVIRQFLAFSPRPGVHTMFRKKRLKVIDLFPTVNEKFDSSSSLVPGNVVKLDGDKIWIQCKTGSIALLKCQPENKAPMKVSDFLNGYQVKEGETLG